MITLDSEPNYYDLYLSSIGPGQIRVTYYSLDRLHPYTAITNDTISYDRYRELIDNGCSSEDEECELQQLYNYFINLCQIH